MIMVSVLYPNEEGVQFDMQYYCDRHIPLVREKLGAACKGVAVQQGMAGAEPGSRPAFVALCHMYFDSVEAFQAVFSQHADELIQDVPNYTNAHPSIQINEVKIPLQLAAAG